MNSFTNKWDVNHLPDLAKDIYISNLDLSSFYVIVKTNSLLKHNTGRERLIRSHSSARFCFELSGNSNKPIPCNLNFGQNFELEISLN